MIWTYHLSRIKSMDSNCQNQIDLLQPILLWNILSQVPSGQFSELSLVGCRAESANLIDQSRHLRKINLKPKLRQLQLDPHGELWFKGQGRDSRTVIWSVSTFSQEIADRTVVESLGQGSFHSSKTIMPKGSIKLSFKQTNAYSQSKMHLYHKGKNWILGLWILICLCSQF